MGAELIDQFIKRCYHEYTVQHYQAKTELVQYLYKQVPCADGPRFKRYILNNKTTFDSLYFPEKEQILHAIKRLECGDLSKLSLLLCGLPGCGKSSIIKAIAAKLQYSVIEVKLSFTRNDADLVDIFHNVDISWKNKSDEKSPIESDILPKNKRIYIFEDIDAECDVIHCRVGSPTVDKFENTGSKKTKKKFDIGKFYQKYSNRGITLAGVLNAFDGVMELNGAVIVMTTNHPEKLDPAFIRPGRITMSVHMKKMLSCDASALINRYFDGHKIEIHDYEITPAELESYCQIANTADDLQLMIARAKS